MSSFFNRLPPSLLDGECVCPPLGNVEVTRQNRTAENAPRIPTPVSENHPKRPLPARDPQKTDTTRITTPTPSPTSPGFHPEIPPDPALARNGRRPQDKVTVWGCLLAGGGVSSAPAAVAAVVGACRMQTATLPDPEQARDARGFSVSHHGDTRNNKDLDM